MTSRGGVKEADAEGFLLRPLCRLPKTQAALRAYELWSPPHWSWKSFVCLRGKAADARPADSIILIQANFTSLPILAAGRWLR